MNYNDFSHNRPFGVRFGVTPLASLKAFLPPSALAISKAAGNNKCLFYLELLIVRFVAGKYLILVLLGILTEGGESIQGLIFVRIILSPHLTYGLLQYEQKL